MRTEMPRSNKKCRSTRISSRRKLKRLPCGHPMKSCSSKMKDKKSRKTWRVSKEVSETKKIIFETTLSNNRSKIINKKTKKQPSNNRVRDQRT